jgi:glycerate kinase
MRAALAAGCRKLLVAIGGSATNDGGAGMAQALGARLLDVEGAELPPGGAALQHLAKIDLSTWALPADATVAVACDVDNPLCGPNGASAVYGPQKGATQEMIVLLDDALLHYARILAATFGMEMEVEVSSAPGAGAAGGLGAGLMAFCGGRLLPGADLVLDITGFDALCRQCQLVITGEGRLDGQTVRGKLIASVARRAQNAGVPVVALVGGMTERAEESLHTLGLTAALSIVDGPMATEHAVRDADRLLLNATTRLLRLLTLWL